jgi:hypothetical protein
MASLPDLELTLEQHDQVIAKAGSLRDYFNFLHTNRIYYMGYRKSISEKMPTLRP